MTHSDAIDTTGVSVQGRRPRVVILGEFSAGKSTLINLFTGGANLRTQVTATQMPPVWISHGTGEPTRVDLEGKEHSVDPSNPDSISVSDTLYVRTFMNAPLLEMFDLIDTPGNSDPNIASAAWERAAELADIAVWCSSSTQAWRQSELSAWREVPESVRARSILLLTRADKLTSDEDRAKVLNRVKREAGDLFTHIHMASLLELENTRGVLKDLVEMAETMKSAAQAVSTAPTPNVTDLLDPPQAADVSDEASKNPAQNQSNEMTDDMLIDSLDLSGEANLDDLALSNEGDADMDEVLAALTNATPTVAAVATAAASTSTLVESEAAETVVPMPQATEVSESPAAPQQEKLNSDDALVAEGYASELWRQMSLVIPHDDHDAYETAFDMFLEKVDTEIATLRGQLNIKAAG